MSHGFIQIRIYTEIHLSIKSVKVCDYPSAELTFFSLTFNIVTNRQTVLQSLA